MTEHNPLLEQPAPDFDEMVRVLKGQHPPRRVHLVELGIDGEVLEVISERYLGRPWQSWGVTAFDWTPPEAYYEQYVNIYYRLGYDYAPIWACYKGHPMPVYRIAADTAEQNRGERKWVEEGKGLIQSWEDLEAFPWDAIQPDITPHVYTEKLLPPGMKQVALTTLFEHSFERLLGFEGMAYLLYDDPDLVKAVFDHWGQKVYDYYAAVIGMQSVGAIFHADDMGFKTSTLIAPDALRKLVFPWFRRYAELAHTHGKPFFLHSCGNLYRQGVIEDLIEDVKIDGLHSFQDVILPVTDFKATYGHRVATLGGVDVDKIARLDEGSLRAYVRDILEKCMPGGRFALGTGNTVANYVPVEHFAIMLEESRAWRPS